MFQSTRSLLRGATTTPLRTSWSRQQQVLACSRPAALSSVRSFSTTGPTHKDAAQDTTTHKPKP
ncbi:hypothetical protein BGZ97_011510, partial [Linnemannia gamsii]